MFLCICFKSVEWIWSKSFKQTLFPIVQGSVYKDLRKKSAEEIAKFEREGKQDKLPMLEEINKYIEDLEKIYSSA